MISIGTCHFMSIREARKYYVPFWEPEWLHEPTLKTGVLKIRCGVPTESAVRKDKRAFRKHIDGMVKRGEIALGPPKLREGETYYVNDEGRYFVRVKS